MFPCLSRFMRKYSCRRSPQELLAFFDTTLSGLGPSCLCGMLTPCWLHAHAHAHAHAFLVLRFFCRFSSTPERSENICCRRKRACFMSLRTLLVGRGRPSDQDLLPRAQCRRAEGHPRGAGFQDDHARDGVPPRKGPGGPRGKPKSVGGKTGAKEGGRDALCAGLTENIVLPLVVCVRQEHLFEVNSVR